MRTLYIFIAHVCHRANGEDSNLIYIDFVFYIVESLVKFYLSLKLSVFYSLFKNIDEKLFSSDVSSFFYTSLTLKYNSNK